MLYIWHEIELILLNVSNLCCISNPCACNVRLKFSTVRRHNSIHRLLIYFQWQSNVQLYVERGIVYFFIKNRNIIEAKLIPTYPYNFPFLRRNVQIVRTSFIRFWPSLHSLNFFVFAYFMYVKKQIRSSVRDTNVSYVARIFWRHGYLMSMKFSFY